MSAKIISERKTVTEKIPTLVFRLKKTGDVCASYGRDNNGNPVFEKEYKDIQEQGYQQCLTDPSIEGPFPVTETRRYTEDARAVCECGKTIELYDQYLGACECPYCGLWHNLFGQTLKNPEHWEPDYAY